MEDLRDHSAPFQYFQVSPPVHCIIILVCINKYLIQDLLLHAHNIMEEFGLECGRFSPSPRFEPVQYIVELDGIHQMRVNDDINDLPENSTRPIPSYS